MEYSLRYTIDGLLLGIVLVFISLFWNPKSGKLVVTPPYNPVLLVAEKIDFRKDLFKELERAYIATHEVGNNESLYMIAKKYGSDVFTIRSSNSLDLDTVKPGDILKIPNHKGTLYEVKEPENLQTIQKSFSIGRRLGDAYRQTILLMNDFPLPDMASKDFAFRIGSLLFLPEAWKPSGLPIPVTNFRLTSRYGIRKHPVSGVVKMHRGLDLAKPYGSPVVSSREGVVTYAGWMGGYGNLIEIRHVLKGKNGPKALRTRYGHLSKILVHEGQRVSSGQLIGRVGSTGISTGPHLHFEVREESGKTSNPGKYF